MFANITPSTNVTLSCLPFDAYFLRVPRNIHFDNFLLAMISINALMACVASCSNAVVIYTITRTPSLQTPSNVLILGLAISDLSVGVFSQPSYCLYKIAELRRSLTFFCTTGKMYTFSTLPLATVSFLTLTAITADRFLAVHFHLRYQDIVTTKRAGIALGCIWVVALGFAVYTVIIHDKIEVIIVNTGLFVTLLFLNVYFIFKVCLVVRRHSLQIQSQQSGQQSINMAVFRKSVKIVFYVIGSFMLCYVPYGVSRMAYGLVHLRSYGLLSGFIMSETFVMMNGVLNPIIYCWRIEGIRNAAMLLLRKMCRQNQN